MKNLSIILLLLVITKMNAQSNALDKILGKWELIKLYEDNIDISDECMRKTIITFFKDGTCNILDYNEESEYDSTCSVEKRTSTWKSVGNSNYNFGNHKTTKIYFEKNMFYTINFVDGYKMKKVYRKVY